jgi:glycosyltransferase involved in cell wall biosynthesis
LSVVTPVYNDADGIDATLRSVAAQDHPDYEVLPVDNNSTDATPTVIASWADRHPDRIRPLEERAVQSSYAARNTGVEAAQGDVIVFIDADMTVPTHWLRRIEAVFADQAVDYLGYEIEIYVPEGEEGIWGWYDQMLGLPSRYFYEQKQFVPTASLAVRRRVFDEVGLFDATLASGGDKNFGRRVFRHPTLRTHFADDIVVYHPARTRFREHYEKAIRIGRGMAQSHGELSPARLLDAVPVGLLMHLPPPNPLRMYRMSGPLAPSRFALLYGMSTLIRYVRLYGALTYYLGLDPDGSPPAAGAA